MIRGMHRGCPRLPRRCHTPRMMAIAARRAIRPRAGVRGIWLGAAVGYAAATVAVVAGNAGPTSCPAASTVSAVADLAAGLGLTVAGGWWTVRRSRVVGPLVLGLGAAWLAADWVGWLGAPPLVRSMAALAVPFAPAVLLHVTLAYPGDDVSRL